MRVEVADQGSHNRLLRLVVFERFWQCLKQLFMSKMKWFFSLALRILAFGATVSAAIVMGTSRETARFFSVSFEAKYSDIPSFKYFVIMEAITSIYCFLVIFLPAKSFLWRFIVIADLIFAMLLTSSIAAALAVAQVGKYGNSHAGWLPICGQVPQYCDHVTGALGAGFAAVVIFLVILLSTIYTLNPVLV